MNTYATPFAEAQAPSSRSHIVTSHQVEQLHCVETSAARVSAAVQDDARSAAEGLEDELPSGAFLTGLSGARYALLELQTIQRLARENDDHPGAVCLGAPIPLGKVLCVLGMGTDVFGKPTPVWKAFTGIEGLPANGATSLRPHPIDIGKPGRHGYTLTVESASISDCQKLLEEYSGLVDEVGHAQRTKPLVALLVAGSMSATQLAQVNDIGRGQKKVIDSLVTAGLIESAGVRRRRLSPAGEKQALEAVYASPRHYEMAVHTVLGDNTRRANSLGATGHEGGLSPALVALHFVHSVDQELAIGAVAVKSEAARPASMYQNALRLLATNGLVTQRSDAEHYTGIPMYGHSLTNRGRSALERFACAIPKFDAASVMGTSPLGPPVLLTAGGAHELEVNAVNALRQVAATENDQVIKAVSLRSTVRASLREAALMSVDSDGIAHATDLGSWVVQQLPENNLPAPTAFIAAEIA